MGNLEFFPMLGGAWRRAAADVDFNCFSHMELDTGPRLDHSHKKAQKAQKQSQ